MRKEIILSDFDWQNIIDRHYPEGNPARGILLSHSRAVADEALSIARRKHLPLDEADIEAAAMLHDIGIIGTNAPALHCHGEKPYLWHGSIGADMLRADGAPERYALVSERHTGAGITAEDIAANGLPMPPGRDYMPQSLLERLICYADCFYSKTGDGKRKPLERVEAGMAKFGQAVAERFALLHKEFGNSL